MTATFATLQDLENRHPAELITLAADEQSGERDDDRIELAVKDAAAEIRAILKARYTSEDLARLDQDSLDTLKLYSIDISLYRIAIAFDRSNERIEKRYDTAIKRLEAIAAGRGGLTIISGSAPSSDSSSSSSISPNEVLIDAPDRLFTRDRMRGQ